MSTHGKPEMTPEQRRQKLQDLRLGYDQDVGWCVREVLKLDAALETLKVDHEALKVENLRLIALAEQYTEELKDLPERVECTCSAHKDPGSCGHHPNCPLKSVEG